MSQLPSIAIIIGSTRPGRVGASVGQWVFEEASSREDAAFTLVDLADFGLGLLNEATSPGAANRAYENPATRVWSQEIDKYDGYVFVTPEYNHGVPAAFKNALDLLYPEWNDKTVAFVGYGADGGVRSIEHWRTIVANVRLHATRAQLSLSLFTDFEAGRFTPSERRAGELKGVLNQLLPLTVALRGMREGH